MLRPAVAACHVDLDLDGNGIDAHPRLFYNQSMRAPQALVALATLTLLTVLTGGAACKPDLIPGTSVEDSADNHEVIDFLGKYRDAVVARNPDAVVGLTTADYFEDNGTVEQGDDYGRDKLKEKLTADFQRTKEIQLEIIVQQIERPAGEQGLVRVAFRYSQRALVDFPAGQKWISVSDVNRLVLARDGAAGYLIASGL